ncbi:MAG TPA: endolytic transglycosylase MltG [Anaerolineaceae bacterium]|nr:endolytic transglycosylase MltG [Anaerolineaceae bacterium]
MTPLLVILLGAACILILAGLGGLAVAPRLAEQSFGPPSPGLGQFEKALYSIQLLLQKNNLLEPADPAGSAKPFTIDQGESVNSIALNLENAGIIRDAGAFRLYLIYSGLDKGIQAGDHQLSPAQTALEVAKGIQDATPRILTLRVYAGWRTEEIAAALQSNGFLIDAQNFLTAAAELKGEKVLLGYPDIQSVEGYLFPDDYRFNRDVTAEEILMTMLQHFDEAVSQDLRDAIRRQGLSLEDAVTLASIVQKEAVVPDEQPIIASVFYNRMQKGMKLDSDPTVQYALGFDPVKKTWWKNPLSASDLKFVSPYNTYINTGLPPGPISNLGISALQAVAYPAQTPYYYFRARCDGSGRHFFSATYEEHLNNACQ